MGRDEQIDVPGAGVDPGDASDTDYLTSSQTRRSIRPASHRSLMTWVGVRREHGSLCSRLASARMSASTTSARPYSRASSRGDEPLPQDWFHVGSVRDGVQSPPAADRWMIRNG